MSFRHDATIEGEIYRYRDRQGNVVGNPGNPRCLNRTKGGESAHHGFSPFFVYVATVVHELRAELADFPPERPPPRGLERWFPQLHPLAKT